MARRELYEVKTGVTTTTDGTTAQTMNSFDISTGAPGGGALTNCTIFAVATTAGYDTTSTAGGGERVGAVFKVVSGTLSQVGATTHIIPMIDDIPATPNSDLNATGTTIRHQVTGSTGETIEWFGRLELYIYQPA